MYSNALAYSISACVLYISIYMCIHNLYILYLLYLSPSHTQLTVHHRTLCMAIQLLEAYENEHYFQLVMEKHGDGLDLFEFIERCPKLTEPLVSYMFRQVVAGLSHLHSKNILHRDVKVSYYGARHYSNGYYGIIVTTVPVTMVTVIIVLVTMVPVTIVTEILAMVTFIIVIVAMVMIAVLIVANYYRANSCLGDRYYGDCYRGNDISLSYVHVRMKTS